MAIGKVSRNAQIKTANEEFKQVTTFKHLECLVREDMSCSQDVNCRIALVKEALSRKKRLLSELLDIKQIA